MGLSASQHDHAWYRNEPRRRIDSGKAPPGLRQRRRRRGIPDRLILAFALILCAATVGADPLRIASYNTELKRDGPGLLLRDIVRGEDPQIAAVVKVLVTTAPDIVTLQSFDYDLTGRAIAAFTDVLRDAGLDYPFAFSAQPNAGMYTGLDMDGDNRRAEPRDAQSYGRFSGQGGMVILSRYPILEDAVQNYSDLLWRAFPGALLPEKDGAPFPSEEALAIQRLSTTGHWVVPVEVPKFGRIDLLTMHASPPVFDGPEDRNGKRNHDEITFWLRYLDGQIGPASQEKFILLGDFNQDPDEGEGIKDAIRSILSDPRLQDPAPESAGSAALTGDTDDTADWDDPVPGNMRVDYVLPSADLQVIGTGVYWPVGAAGEVAATASRHRLVWVDLAR